MAPSCSQSLRNLSRSGPSAPWTISASMMSTLRTGMKCSRSPPSAPCANCWSIVHSSQGLIVGDEDQQRTRSELWNIGRLDHCAPALGVAFHDLGHVLRRAATDLKPEFFVL